MKSINKKNIKKFIRAIILITFLLSCNQIYIPKAESKISNENLNKTLDLHAMAVKYDELVQNDLYTPIDTYNGDLTGYVADCPLCGGTLGCTGEDVLTNRITTHNDKEYGVVNIVASSKNLPCGSIIQFSFPNISNEKITAIVLDRGVVGTSIDLLVENINYAKSNIGRNQISYDILRLGYER
ncbi:MAG: hypothetical protein PHS24_02010 [Bacilli bacterium]|nr:hypothetical protein [Bacilli bacterium]